MISRSKGQGMRIGGISAALWCALAVTAALAVGCPPANPGILDVDPGGWEVGSAAGNVTFGVWNDGAPGMSWSATVIQGGSWLSIVGGSSGYDDGSFTVAYQANTQAAPRTGLIRITAPGATGSPVTVSVVQDGASSNNGGDIQGDWGGFWWYSGTMGDVYITWDFDGDDFVTNMPGQGVTVTGTYTVNTSVTPHTLDITVATSNTSAWVVGKTYRGYYKIENGTMYRSQMFETRPTLTPTLLDPFQATVFVASPL